MDSTEDASLHYMTIPRSETTEWDPRMTMTSPVEWETSPLVSQQSSGDGNSSLPTPPLSKPKYKTTPDVVNRNQVVGLPDVITNNKAAHLEKLQENTSADEVVLNRKTFFITHSRTTKNRNLMTNKQKHCDTEEESEHFIIVNVPESAFSSMGGGDLDDMNHNTIPSIADDTVTVVSEGVKCRYCLTSDTLSNEPLISPCQCCGTSKFVHQSCLEKWLTLRNLEACEVCKTHYKTKWVHRPLCSLNFPSMKKHDVLLLIITISFYATLIFQFLGAVYVSMMASALTPMVTIVTLIGLSLGLLWFLTGSIALTIILYTSDYWRAWRKANKKKVIVIDDPPLKSHLLPANFPKDLSQAVAV